MSRINSSEYIYVMASTLNQMVNYIPLKYYDFKFKDIYNITVEDSKYFTNKRWNKHLEQVLKEEGFTKYTADDTNKNLTIEQEEINNIDDIIEMLEANFNDYDKVFWNITGGQRPIILAIQKFIKDSNRKDDLICYLEGNNSKMVVFKNYERLEESSYNTDNLKISTALKLMGFEIKETKTSERNLVQTCDENEKKFYLEFLDEYIKDKKLRENLILLNRDSEKTKAKEEIKKLLKDLNYSKINEELEKNKAFGYILEKLAGYKILDLSQDKIADMSFGEKINYLRDEDKADEYHIDEFDIALLTKNGKFMIFECKSGGMEGDVAKSTKYSTYAISGVYGLPILITPLLSKEIEALRNKEIPKDYKYLKDNLYKTIRQAINSAIRAGLEVWGLDEIEEKLKKYLD